MYGYISTILKWPNSRVLRGIASQHFLGESGIRKSEGKLQVDLHLTFTLG
jgi:hypothetical protein